MGCCGMLCYNMMHCCVLVCCCPVCCCHQAARLAGMKDRSRWPWLLQGIATHLQGKDKARQGKALMM